MRIVLIFAAIATLFVVDAAAAQGNPVRPDPRYKHVRRPEVCSQSDASRTQVCNITPGSYARRADCNTLVIDRDGLTSRKCPEDAPGYQRLQRAADFARTCGEQGRMCLDAYVFRENDYCVYSVVGDYEPKNRYDIHIRDLAQWQRAEIYLVGTSRHKSLETKHRRQERLMRYHENNPHKYRSRGDCD